HHNINPPPHTSDLEVYCDGSFLEDPQKAGFGVILMNTGGQICDGRAGTLVCSSPIVSEARALLEAVSLARLSPVRCTVFSDCLTLVNCVSSPSCRWPWECYGLLASIMSVIRTSPTIQVRFTPRRNNMLADWVARSARDSCLPENWLYAPFNPFNL
ncbi:hypothetical protein LINPERHAP1_LOCUS27430, partial [Linum perenne]